MYVHYVLAGVPKGGTGGRGGSKGFFFLFLFFLRSELNGWLLASKEVHTLLNYTRYVALEASTAVSSWDVMHTTTWRDGGHHPVHPGRLPAYLPC